MNDQGDLKDYLGVNITTLQNGQIKLSQPHLVEQIINESIVSVDSRTKVIPANSYKILVPDYDGPEIQWQVQLSFHHWTIKFLRRKYAARHRILGSPMCSIFCYSERIAWKCHRAYFQVLKRIHWWRYYPQDWFRKVARSLCRRRLCRKLDEPDAECNVNTAKSRTGYFISFLGCPITWCSKLQTTITLSSTEAEYMSLSHSMRDAIPLIGLIEEIISKEFNFRSNAPKVHCKAFEDNMGVF